ncbi:Glucose/arabinose dehydrogenase, beta-propeller fold [Flavobacterium segetis]|uniref:Glucose/arabinose dehydrogenase, beta-propeller fold n=1 Tax=Flavobacterium segetis TaxID=271157 RepID=A0A1M5G5M1_9FLAO|nr:PQQ-dependent sugar dehydrogenase [Flavobacterium segetis]SHF98751.1 Glucose/arabinose dehydrogenase, beta-propeller fold [Flavobacterium segetis]
MKIPAIISLSIIAFISYSCDAQVKPNDIVLEDDAKNYKLEVVAADIAIPWGMAWLPDGTMLVTEKSGVLYHIKKGIKTEIKNVPAVYTRGQGGLLDIALHPDYARNGWIYITYSSDEGEGSGGNTKLIRAKLLDGSLTQIESLYKATPNTTKGQHFGSRIVFDNEGYLYFSIGERGNEFVNPQDIMRDGGKIYRLNDDGSIPKDNPFVGQAGVKEAIYTYGNRNPQGIAKNPITGAIWAHEHGPKGGDEINIIKKGANYGWPLVTYGIDYDGTTISKETEKAGIERPIYYWLPSIAPSGMAFVTGDIYSDWKGHLLVGSLKFQYLELVKLKGNEVVGRQKIATDVGRLRDVKQGPDGFIYMGIEGKGIVKIIPN